MIWRRPSLADLAYGALVLALTFMAARVWWLSAIVPGQDYPQFLVFVRAAQDCGDPSSPFHGTYNLAPWYVPTSLPVQLARLLAVVCGGSIEAAGKVMLTFQNVGLVAAGAYLLHVLGRPRWAIVMLFPFILSRWTVIGGYFAYATSFPLVLLGWALTVRWFECSARRYAVLLGACFVLVLLWHGLGFAALGLGFAALWLTWRAPTVLARVRSVLPVTPALVPLALWLGSTFRTKPEQHVLAWRPPWDAADKLLDHVMATVPHSSGRALLLAILVIGGLITSPRQEGAPPSRTRMWRTENPFLVVAGFYLLAYFALPVDGLGVAILSQRFSIQAATAAVFAWTLPVSRVLRSGVVVACAVFSAWYLNDVAMCFRAFDAETRGASYLMDRVGLHETLYHWPSQGGGSNAFAMPNHALIELEQFSTARHGGLPNSSFAGYGMNYVRYTNGDPMPFLHGAPTYSQAMTRFDYVLVRAAEGLNDPRFARIDEREGWQLYGVCGSKRFPTCGGAGG